MKKTKYLLMICIFIFNSFYTNNIFSQGDVTLNIPATSINETIATLLDTKGLNIARYTGNTFGVTSFHVQVNSAYITFDELTQNGYLHLNITGSANLNLVLFSFEISATAGITLIGNVVLETYVDGYKLKLTPSGFTNFVWTGVGWFDDLVSNLTFAGYLSSLPEVSFVSYTPLLPNIVSQYFTTSTPNLRIKNDGVDLFLNVNEGYLAYDNVNYTKNHSYRYLEGGMDYVIQPGGNITFTHGSYGVNLTDGFTVEEGGIFTTIYDQNLDSEGDSPVYTNTAGKNLYVLDTAKPENITKPRNIPLKYELYQNYPNPFNPSTTIKYDLKNDGKVSLVIYDIIGREVIKLVDWNEEAGYKSVTWDGRNKMGNQISSGVYFYTLRTGDFVKTVKMVFVK